MGTAYLVISDLHFGQLVNPNRIDYARETRLVEDQIYTTVDKYLAQGHEVVILFLGDVYHRDYDTVFSGTAENNKMIALRNKVSAMYAALGNHETTYYQGNPFWTLVSRIQSTRISANQKKVWQPQGVFPVIEIPDELVDGNVRFIFNHHGLPVVSPTRDGKTTIGLFHHDLYAKELVSEMERSYGTSVYEHSPVYFTSSTVLSGYNYACLGHMHMMYGEFNYVCPQTSYNTRVMFLSSSGRTNHLEVNNKMLERNIPVFIVDNGHFVGKENNLYYLLPREQCIKEDVVQVQQAVRKTVNENVSLAKEYIPLGDDPLENIRSTLAPHPVNARIYEQMLTNGKLESDLRISVFIETLLGGK